MATFRRHSNYSRCMGSPRSTQRNSRLWLYAVIGAVVGSIIGFLTNSTFIIPLAIFGFAMAMGICWILHSGQSSNAETPEATEDLDGKD